MRELIDLAYDLGEQDDFGLTPLHLSIYWPLGMKILLAAGVQPDGGVLANTREWVREPLTPLHYAIYNRQDEAILVLLNADSSLSCGEYHALERLIDCHYEPWSLVVTATIEAMMERSNRLRNLAIAHLSPCELNRLYISHGDESIKILDAYAAPTANALENVGVKIPGALKPNSVVGTFYNCLERLSPELADQLWSSGFRDIDVQDEYGLTPLEKACWEGQLDMVNWFMSHGGDPTTVVKGHSQNAFHLLSWGLNECLSYTALHEFDTKLLDIASRMGELCGTSCYDSCRCACSPQGCTPTAILLRRASRPWYEKSDLFSSWCRSLDLSPDATEICCLEFARLETFERLGITHVCCEFQYWPVSDPMPQDTIDEIQDEESEMIDQLESWMVLYKEEKAKFEGSAVDFLSKWSDMLKDELDVPAPFEEYWTGRCRHDSEIRMPDYFAKPLHSKGDTHIT